MFRHIISLPPLFVKDYDKIRERLLPKLESLTNHPERYKRLIEFLVLAEDRRFFSHPGFDIIGICRAIYKDIFKGKREGASTIEQQLVRVLTEDYRYSFKRKLKEIYLAVKLKHFADKYTLAAAYLNMANYGTGLSGLASVLDKYGVDIKQDIDDEICAAVVARLKYPEPRRYNAVRMAQIERRTKYILQLFHQKERA